ncbi:MAG: hypothetical protein EOM50_00045 [Erysipelotrichia bacterium]|nr:hypothetical protein [Erysipelotrichia bacterium]NCC55012.1 hypothetical protein [Erysipelotrichia bacterium]
MKTETKKVNQLAKELLNAVYDEDVARMEAVIKKGADPSWIFNGYPILLHAIYLANKQVVFCLIRHGAIQLEEALGFALEQGIGSMVVALAIMGVAPKAVQVKTQFGELPSRFAPTSIAYIH